MSFCKSCGTALNDQATACPSCGAQSNVAGYTPVAAAGVPVTPVAPAASTGLSANGAGALAYLVGLITGIIFLVIEPYKTNPFVRFHAFQSIFFHVAWIVFWIGWMVVGFVLTAISKGLFGILLIPINLLIALGGLCLWLYLMYSAYQGKTLKLPIIGPLAAKQAGL